jgi:hypothetical protein
MSRKLDRRLVPLGAAALFIASTFLALSGALPASADVIPTPRPVGPDEVFTAFVNGRSGESVVNVNCDTSAGGTKSGHPAAGQNVEVLAGAVRGPVPASIGFTGSAAKEIGAGVGFSESPVPPIHLPVYGRLVEIPTSAVVPCDGAGVVTFVPQPNSLNAVQATVKVTFVSVVTKA